MLVCLLRGRSTPEIRAISTPVASGQRPVVSYDGLPLPLFMFRILTNDADNTLAVDDLAFVANRFYGCPDFHNCSFQFPVASLQTTLFVSINDSAAVQVVG